MRDLDERIAAVERRSLQLADKRRRTAAGIGAAISSVLLLCVVLVGASAAQTLPRSAELPLYGAASLLGPSAGGYALIAVGILAFVVLVLSLVMMFCQASQKKGDSHGKFSQ